MANKQSRQEKRDAELLNEMYSRVKLYEEQIEQMPPLRVFTPEYFKNAGTNNISRSSSEEKRIKLMNDVKNIKEGIKKLERKINIPKPAVGVIEYTRVPHLRTEEEKYWKAYVIDNNNGNLRCIGEFDTKQKAHEAYSSFYRR